MPVKLDIKGVARNLIMDALALQHEHWKENPYNAYMVRRATPEELVAIDSELCKVINSIYKKFGYEYASKEKV